VIGRGRFIGGASALAAGALAGPARAAFGDQSLAAVTTIGVVAPLTGKDLRLGEQIGDGVRAAIDQANLMRGSLDRIFAIRTFDDENLLATGIVNAQFACDDATISCVIGHLSGSITDVALRTYALAGMPVIVPASSFDRITSHNYPYVWRLTTKDSTEGRLSAKTFGALLKPQQVVVLNQDGDYGYDVALGAVQELDAAKIPAKALTFSWDKADFAAVAKQTLASNPDVVFLAGLVRDMGPLVPALRSAGYKGAFYASQGFFDQQTIAKYGADAEGLTVSSSMPPLALAPSAFRFRLDFESKYGQMSPLSAFSYAAAQIAIAACRRVGAADRAAEARSLALPYAYDTIVGTLQFSPTGDPLDPNLYFYTVTDGKWKYTRAAHPSAFVLK
jgi:ABC-type branched-subunit amino acid transport system substrate-binding protein